MLLIINADSSHFFVNWMICTQEIISSIVTFSSDESIHGSKDVSDRQIISYFFDTDMACNKNA